MPMNEFRITFVPRWADIDANQHLKNTAFSEWATYVRSEWLASFGFETAEIFLGEHIVIDLELVGLKQECSQFHVRHTFRRDDTVCAVHNVKGAWLDIASRRVAAPTCHYDMRHLP